MMDNISAAYIEPTKGNSSQIIGCCIFDKTSVDVPQKLFKKYVSFPGTQRMRMRCVKVLGDFYWYPEKDFRVRKHIAISNYGQMNTLGELFQFMGDEMNVPLNKNQALWKLILIPNFKRDKSAMIIKYHHSLGDGIALQYFISQSSTVKGNIVQQYFKTNWKQMLCSYLSIPILIPLVIGKTLCIKPDKNILTYHNTKPLQGKKMTAYTGPYSLKKIKKLCKSLNVTINDFIFSLILSSLGKYFRKAQGMSEIKINVGVPFNVRKAPKKGKHITMSNKFAVFFFSMPMFEINEIKRDSKEAFTLVRNKTNNIKRSLQPLAFRQMAVLNDIFPHRISKLNLQGPSDKCTMMYSNVAGTSSPFYFEDKQVYDILFIGPTMGRNCLGISVSSYCDNFTILCHSDVSRMEDPSLFMEILQADLKAFFLYSSQSNQDQLEDNSHDEETKIQNFEFDNEI